MLVKCADCDEIIDNAYGKLRCPECAKVRVAAQQREAQDAERERNKKLPARRTRTVNAHAIQELGTVRAERLLDQILKGKVDYVGTR